MTATHARKVRAVRFCWTVIGLLAVLPGLSGRAASADQVAGPAPIGGEHGMVVTAHRIASQVGVDILKSGGNAIDAAVAVGYALAVVYPVAGNLGGGGFMTLRLADGHETFLDFRERAPRAAKPDMYLGQDGNPVPGLSTDGWLSVGVPGTVAGLEYAREHWGTLTRSALLAPAIRLAETGFVLDGDDTEIVDNAELLRAHPALTVQFMKGGGTSFAPGDRLVQKALAASLRLIARQGAAAFYRGPIANAIVAASTQGHGILTRADFLRYRVRELAPIVCDYRGYRVVSAPPPSSGGVTLCEMLHILEGFPLAQLPFHSTEEVHDLAEAMRLAYADRNDVLGDPSFVRNPVARLIDTAYAARLRTRIDPVKAGVSSPSAAPHEGNNTTHFSIVDNAGNAVSVTYSLNDRFGAKVVGGNSGIVLNDTMDDFTTKIGAANQFGLVQGAANAIAPGKTPLSSMSPTILTHNGRTVMVIGSPGGPRIITTALETIVNTIDHGMTISAAIAAPRVHHQWLPDTLFAEKDALAPDVAAALGHAGYQVRQQGTWSQAEGILIGGPSLAPPRNSGLRILDALDAPHETHMRLFGAADPRGASGAALGY